MALYALLRDRADRILRRQRLICPPFILIFILLPDQGADLRPVIVSGRRRPHCGTTAVYGICGERVERGGPNKSSLVLRSAPFSKGLFPLGSRRNIRSRGSKITLSDCTVFRFRDVFRVASRSGSRVRLYSVVEVFFFEYAAISFFSALR